MSIEKILEFKELILYIMLFIGPTIIYVLTALMIIYNIRGAGTCEHHAWYSYKKALRKIEEKRKLKIVIKYLKERQLDTAKLDEKLKEYEDLVTDGIFFPLLRVLFLGLRFFDFTQNVKTYLDIKRSKWMSKDITEWYIVFWILQELAFLNQFEYLYILKPVVVIFLSIRLAQILNKVYYYYFLKPSLTGSDGVNNHFRSVIIVLVYYIEIVLIYTYFYAMNYKDIAGIYQPDIRKLMYFSLTTISTLGYGEFHPESTITMVLTSSEVFIGVTFLAIIIGRIIGNTTKNSEIYKEI